MSNAGRMDRSLIGIGLYTPTEAGRLLGIPAGRISRWLSGHETGGVRYEPLWSPQVDLGQDEIALGFRDLIEVRVADALIAGGISAQRVRRGIGLARDIVGANHPLSTSRFRTDGRSVFLQIAEEDGEPRLLDIFSSQYAFHALLEPSLRNVEIGEDGAPARWWPMGRAKSIVVDPARSFGQPIEAESSVPTAALAAAFEAEGSVEGAAQAWGVQPRAIRRAVAFHREIGLRKAA